MEQIILEHPFLSFLGLCIIVDGIATIVNNVLRLIYSIVRKSKEE